LEIIEVRKNPYTNKIQSEAAGDTNSQPVPVTEEVQSKENQEVVEIVLES